MLLFSTILFVDGEPVGYQVNMNEDQLLLKPAENPSRRFDPPVLMVYCTEGTWHVQGTNHHDLIEQVLNDIKKNKVVPKSGLTAAP